MNTRRFVVALTAVLIAVSALLFTSMKAKANAMPSDAGSNSDLRTLDKLAASSENSDSAAHRELVLGVVRAVGVDKEVTEAADSIVDRVSKTETAFHSDKGHSVSEQNVAAAINDLARQINAPKYAFTSKAEIRRLRVHLMFQTPNLIGRRSALDDKSSRQRLADRMSPAEGFYVFAMMVRQKMLNPSYQHTQEEQDKVAHSSQLAPEDPTKLSQERVVEMENLVRTKASQVSGRDVLSQAQSTLDILGMDR